MDHMAERPQWARSRADIQYRDAKSDSFRAGGEVVNILTGVVCVCVSGGGGGGMEEGSRGMVHVVSVGTYVGAVLVRFTHITTACLIWVERTYSLGSSMRGYPNV